MKKVAEQLQKAAGLCPRVTHSRSKVSKLERMVCQKVRKKRDYTAIGPYKGARQRILEIFQMIFSAQDKNIIRKYVFFFSHEV